MAAQHLLFLLAISNHFTRNRASILLTWRYLLIIGQGFLSVLQKKDLWMNIIDSASIQPGVQCIFLFVLEYETSYGMSRMNLKFKFYQLLIV